MSAWWAAWWNARSRREQRLLLVMTVLLVAVLAWLLVARPVALALSRAQTRHAAAVLALADARTQADAIRALERFGPPPPAPPIEALVAERANAAGFTDAHVEPGGPNRATLSLEAARPRAFFPWLADLERRDGVLVETLAVHANSDASLAVQATLRARAR